MVPARHKASEITPFITYFPICPLSPRLLSHAFFGRDDVPAGLPRHWKYPGSLTPQPALERTSFFALLGRLDADQGHYRSSLDCLWPLCCNCRGPYYLAAGQGLDPTLQFRIQARADVPPMFGEKAGVGVQPPLLQEEAFLGRFGSIQRALFSLDLRAPLLCTWGLVYAKPGSRTN